MAKNKTAATINFLLGFIFYLLLVATEIHTEHFSILSIVVHEEIDRWPNRQQRFSNRVL